LLFNFQDLELPLGAIAEFQSDHIADFGWVGGGILAPVAEGQPNGCGGG
jgi:hypothetical protein